MEPSTEVALALHGAPGAYAVLVGSGVSRAAKIPSGWQVVLDLISRLAVADGQHEPADPEAWYHDRYGRSANYSEVLEQLALTRAERQALLRSYFEPSDEERDEGVKVPSDAHCAIADLARRGIVRVILTTNFDRLLEQALDAAGVAHDVWATPDAIAGGVPLVHGNVVVIKLHGDYRDTRVRNTLTELEEYDDAIDELLDQVLDEFGLIVCGWSGVWDAALRDAIMRAKGRRYRTFWAAWHGDVDEAGQQLVDHRRGTVVPIDGADEFFVQVNEKVAAIEESRRPHPDSVATAVATVKRLLPDPRDRIRLTDLVMNEARHVAQETGPARYPTSVPREEATAEMAAARCRQYADQVEILVSMLTHVAVFADRPDHTDVIARAVEVVANQSDAISGLTVLVNLQRFPALVCFYAAGIGAVAAGNWSVLGTMAARPRWHDNRDQHVLAAALNPYRVFDNADPTAQQLAGGERLYTPVSDYLHERLWPVVRPMADTDQRYDELFERFEYLVGVIVTHVRLTRAEGDPYVMPGYVGRIRWRHKHAAEPPPAVWAREHVELLAPALLANADDPVASWGVAAKEHGEMIAAAQKQSW